MNKIVLIGSSFSAGGGLYLEEVHRLYNEKLNIKYLRRDLTNVVYGGILAKKLNCKFENLSKCGVGVDYIFRKFWKYFESNECDDTLFLIEIPGSWYRLDMFSNKAKKHLIVNVNDEVGENFHITDDYITRDGGLNEFIGKEITDNLKSYFKNWYRADILSNKQMYQVITFLNFLIQQNINFLFSPTVQNEDEFYPLLEKYFDTEKFCINFAKYGIQYRGSGGIEYDMFSWANVNSFIIRDDLKEKDSDSHIGILGHKKISEIIYECINNRR